VRTLRTLPALFKIGLANAMAYRAELLIWIFTSTMPLILLPVWHAVAEEAPLRGFSQNRFTAYFLAGFIVRQMVGNWASWTINYEVRTGSLNRRLLRPIHPVWSYATESLASVPMRSALAFPIAVLLIALTGMSELADTTLAWVVAPLAVLGSWAIGFFAHVAIGALSLWMHQSIKVVDVWLAGFYVFSGYLIPVALSPGWLRSLSWALPFPYMHGFPIDVVTGALTDAQLLQRLGMQWAWVLALAVISMTLFQRGLRRYGAFGG